MSRYRDYKVTDRHFARFKTEALMWIEHLGLDEWRVSFQHVFIEGRRAECISSWKSRTATIALTTSTAQQVEPPDEWIDRTAKHEVLHLLLADYAALAGARYVSADEVYAVEERLVMRLERIVGPPA